jgi:hypothetical protein
MRHVVRKQCGRRTVIEVWITRNDRAGRRLLFAPHKQTTIRSPRGKGIQRRLVRALIEEFGQRLLFGSPHGNRLAIDYLCHIRLAVVHVADQNRLSGTNNHAGRLQSHIYSMRAEVTFLRRVIFGIDENCVVRAGCHASFTTDANRLIEIDNAVGPLKHRRRRTGCHTRRMGTLITARHLMGAPSLWKDTDVDMFYIRSGNGERHQVFRLACGGAGMTANAARMVDDLGPLNRTRL